MLIQRYLRAPEHTSFNTKNRRMHPHVDTRTYLCVYIAACLPCTPFSICTRIPHTQMDSI